MFLYYATQLLNVDNSLKSRPSTEYVPLSYLQRCSNLTVSELEEDENVQVVIVHDDFKHSWCENFSVYAYGATSAYDSLIWR
jgi:hypothetical protein